MKKDIRIIKQGDAVGKSGNADDKPNKASVDKKDPGKSKQSEEEIDNEIKIHQAQTERD